MAVDVRIRESQPTDAEYEALVGISNALFPEYQSSAQELRYADQNFDTSKYLKKRYVAEDAITGRIAGHAEYRHRPSRFHPQRFQVWIEVHPHSQRQGIGSRLYERVLEDLGGLGARWAQTQASETMPGSVEFLTRRGFAEISREWESRINPQEFDPTSFQSYLDGVVAQGIEIVTLAEERERDPDWVLKAYDLTVAIERDIPSPNEYTPPSLEHFVRFHIEAPEALLDAYFVAKDGGRYVGESVLGRNLTGPSPLFQDLTGVLREYRGRGIAMALKLKVLEYAKRGGYDMLKTWNSTLNAPMLGINQKLGFVRQPAWIEMEKVLAGGE